MSKFVSLEEESTEVVNLPEIELEERLQYENLEESPISEVAARSYERTIRAEEDLTRLSDAVDENEVSEVSLEMFNIALESIYSSVGIKPSTKLNQASNEGLKASLEEEKVGFFKRTWEAIKKFFRNIWEWIKGLFGFSKKKEQQQQEKIKENLETLDVYKKVDVTAIVDTFRDFNKSLAKTSNALIEDARKKSEQVLNEALEKAKSYSVDKTKIEVIDKKGNSIFVDVATEDDSNPFRESVYGILLGKEPIYFVTSEYNTILGDVKTTVKFNNLPNDSLAFHHLASQISKEAKTKANSILPKTNDMNEFFLNMPDTDLENIIGNNYEQSGIKFEVGGNLFKFNFPEAENTIEFKAKLSDIHGIATKITSYITKSRKELDKEAQEAKEYIEAINKYTDSITEESDLGELDISKIKYRSRLMVSLVRLHVYLDNLMLKNNEKVISLLENYTGTMQFLIKQIKKA